MRKLQRAILLMLLLVGAILFYMAGSAKGIVFLLFIGMLFELGFWLGLFNSPGKNKH